MSERTGLKSTEVTNVPNYQTKQTPKYLDKTKPTKLGWSVGQRNIWPIFTRDNPVESEVENELKA